MARGEGRLAGSGGSDEDDETRIGNDDLGHPAMMADGYARRRTSNPPASAVRISYAGWS
jgi:hypothetical protein